MKKLLSLAGLLLGLLSSTIHAAVERHALVIGNSDYATAALKNPRNDATDMAAVFSELGYQIHRGKALFDLELAEFEFELSEFADQLPDNAIAVLYYAGHGVATESDNYLVPVAAELRYQEQLRTRAVSLRDTVALLSERNPDGLNVLLLDACRDSPLEKQFGRSLRKGLNRIGNLARGSFIGYAADHGQVAIDGDGRNGVYTGELLSAIREFPDLPIQLLHNRVAQRVYEKTESTDYPQLPVSEQKFIGEYCIGPCRSENEGSFALQLSPEDASVCFYNNNWLCGNNIKLPLGREYPVYATADGYSPFQGNARLDKDNQLLSLTFGENTTLSVAETVSIETSNADIRTSPIATTNSSVSNNAPVFEPKRKLSNAAYVAIGIAVLGALIAGSSSGGESADTFTLNVPDLP